MMRTEQVNNIKQWYECGTGKMMVEQYLPKQAEAIAANYAVPQMDNEKKLAGVYHFDFIQEDKQITAYVGESGNIYWRLLEHFYNLVNGVTSWGVPVTEILKKNITIEWYGMTGIVDKELREEVEAVHIKALEPFLQYTENTDPEYGEDKKQKGLTREEIRPDICVCPRLRKERAEALFVINE